MFESFHSSEEECDGKSDELCESSINLDITTGKAELYEGQSNQKENCEYENDEYLMFKPAYEKNRMIKIPKNDKYVNISDMLSRSFVYESIDTKQNESFCTERFNPLNLSLRCDENSPIKIKLSTSNERLQKLQNEVLQSMEIEHQKIMNAKKNSSILKNKAWEESNVL